MGLLLFLVFGLVIGLLARAILPGDQKMGLLMTALLGMAGSFVGGFLGSLVSGESATQLHSAGVIGSLIGSILLLVVVGAVFGRRLAR